MSDLEMGSDKVRRVRSSFTMEPTLFQKLQKKAEEENKSVSAVLEVAVTEFFSK